jgi:hypothetical protein
VDTNYEQIQKARNLGLSVCYANVLSEHVLDEVDLSGIGRFLGMTSNDEVNTIAAARFRELFGRVNVYQLSAAETGHSRWDAEWQRHLTGQLLFSPELTLDRFDSILDAGAEIKVTRLSESFGFEAFQSHYRGRAYPLFLIDGERLVVVAVGSKIAPKPGQLVVSLVLYDRVGESIGSPTGLMAAARLDIRE